MFMSPLLAIPPIFAEVGYVTGYTGFSIRSSEYSGDKAAALRSQGLGSEGVRHIPNLVRRKSWLCTALLCIYDANHARFEYQ